MRVPPSIGMLEIGEEPARREIAAGREVGRIRHRRSGDARSLQHRCDFVLVARRVQFREPRSICSSARLPFRPDGSEAGSSAKFRAADGRAERLPLCRLFSAAMATHSSSPFGGKRSHAATSRNAVAVRAGSAARLGCTKQFRADELHRGLDLRHLDILALTRPLAVMQGRQDGGGGVEAADRVQVGGAGTVGLAAGIADHRGHAGRHLHRRAKRGIAGIGPMRPKAGSLGHDESGLDRRRSVVVVQAKASQLPGRKLQISTSAAAIRPREPSQPSCVFRSRTSERLLTFCELNRNDRSNGRVAGLKRPGN